MRLFDERIYNSTNDIFQEHSFEVSLFAELFNEMLMRDFGFRIYRSLCSLPEKPKEKEDDKKKDKKEDKKKDDDRKSKKDDKRDEKKSDNKDKKEDKDSKSKSDEKDKDKDREKNDDYDDEDDDDSDVSWLIILVAQFGKLVPKRFIIYLDSFRMMILQKTEKKIKTKMEKERKSNYSHLIHIFFYLLYTLIKLTVDIFLIKTLKN